MQRTKKPERLDYYTLFALGVIPLSTVLLSYLISTGDMGIDTPVDWILDLGFIGGQLSFATYMGRILDSYQNKKQEEIPQNTGARVIGPQERFFSLCGLILGTVFSCGLIFLNAKEPLVKTLKGFAWVLFVTRNANNYLSLFNRFGGCLDHDQGSRLPLERKLIRNAIVLGLVLGFLILLTIGISSFVPPILPTALSGIQGLVIGGIPVWANNFVFLLNLTSMFASAADYCAKTLVFLQGHFTAWFGKPDLHLVQRITVHKKEYQGAFLGILLGIIGFGVLAGSGLISGQFLILMGFITLMSCLSLVGGLCSRSGRVLDKIHHRFGLFHHADTHQQSSTSMDFASQPTPSNAVI